MKIFRPLWRDGAFWSRNGFSNRPAGTRRRYGLAWLAHPWELLRARFDAERAHFRLNATRLIVRFADGTLIDASWRIFCHRSAMYRT